MQKRQTILLFFISLLSLLFLSQSALSASIKERMESRLPTINALKKSGIVGENNRGFLEFRGPQKDAATVEAENKDRATVYKAIAKKQGVTVELVGQRRAEKIRAISKPGLWLQKADNSWYKK
ncbi:MAG: hypothetical protein CSB32_01215 [Desulfobacterales bacterium]|nr:MAG: hypothetical protein CSB32_01215 [Desulfobacterales bacterium]